MAWKKTHEHLSRLARKKGAIDAEEARWLVRARRERVHAHLGFGSLIEYLDRLFGYGPRLASEKLRVAEALEELPALREKLGAAALSWSAVRELTRVATPATEAIWIEAASGKTVREVEGLVSGRKPGDSPETPADPAAERTTLRLEVSAETLAAFREVRDAFTREVGCHVEDDELLRMVFERALSAGGQGEGRSPYQVKLSVCTECGRGERAAGGELHPIQPERVEQALCDAQVIGADPEDPLRASQEVPPKIRRSVLRRDGGCIVPGCRNSAFREVHHVIARSEGGTHDPETLADLCSAHHAAVHRGRIRIEGSFSEGFRVLHADGRPYGTAPLAGAPTWVPQAERSDPEATEDSRPEKSLPPENIQADALLALRTLGFKDREARDAVARASAETLEETLREALSWLGRDLGTRVDHRRASRASEAIQVWSGPTLMGHGFRGLEPEALRPA